MMRVLFAFLFLAVANAAVYTFTVTASGTTAWNLAGNVTGLNAAFSARSGDTIIFSVDPGAIHVFAIHNTQGSSSASDRYTSGVSPVVRTFSFVFVLSLIKSVRLERSGRGDFCGADWRPQHAVLPVRGSLKHVRPHQLQQWRHSHCPGLLDRSGATRSALLRPNILKETLPRSEASIVI
jgi:hypothetical protein